METENCRIRHASAADLEAMLSWRNHPNVRAYMLTQHEILIDEHRRWFERCSRDPSRHLMIVEENRNPLGFVGFSGAGAGAVATWGFYVAPEAAKGAGTKLGFIGLEFAFSELRVHKVCGQSLAFNEPSIRMHQKFGFRQEGLLREQHKINENYHDIICFGLLSEQWNMRSRNSA